MKPSDLAGAKETISSLLLQKMKNQGVCAVGTGSDDQGGQAVIIHLDPMFPDARQRASELIAPLLDKVPVKFVEDGPFRKLSAS